MEVWLQTRGVVQDYAFLCETPPDFWWSGYGDFTSFECPTLILERVGEEGRWRCLVSGLPSSRRDRVNTKIRYTLVMDGSAEAKETLLRVLANVLFSFRVHPAIENNQLTRLLDEGIGSNADHWLAGKGVQVEAQEYIKGLRAQFVSLEAPPLDDKIDRAIQDLLDGSQEGVSSIYLFNFIAKEEDPSAIELREKLASSQGRVLVLSSPVYGGILSDGFYISSCAEPSSECKAPGLSGLEPVGRQLGVSGGNFDDNYLNKSCNGMDKVKNVLTKYSNKMNKVKDFLPSPFSNIIQLIKSENSEGDRQPDRGTSSKTSRRRRKNRSGNTKEEKE